MILLTIGVFEDEISITIILIFNSMSTAFLDVIVDALMVA